MGLRISNLSGEIPRLHPRLLPNSFAQTAINTQLISGTLVPLRRSRYEYGFDSYMRSIYKHKGQWYGWAKKGVTVAPGPVADDRLYVAGDGAPKVMVDGQMYPLAVPRPATGPTAAVIGTVDQNNIQTLVYVYTYVTEFDEEGEPSPLSNEVSWSPGRTVRLTDLPAVPAGRKINRQRFYRSQTSASRVTTLFFVKERAASSADFLDDVDANKFQNPLPSADYNPPPGDMAGIVAMPNGMMAGFSGKRLYLCEPYKPHAWPEKYVLTTDYPVVGLGVFGQSLAILTTGCPYVAAGTTPDSMVMERVHENLPCLSATGIVSMGQVVAYPSADGVAVVSLDGARLIDSLMTTDQWRSLAPESIIAGRQGQRYLFSYRRVNADATVERGITIVDLSGEQPYLSRTSNEVQAMFSENGTGKLYLLKDGIDVYEWNSAKEGYVEQVWRSKQFVLPGHTNFGAILIEGQDPYTPEQLAAKQSMGGLGDTDNSAADDIFAPSAFEDPYVMVSVYADGAKVADETRINEAVRLPDGFRALQWEVEVRGTMQVNAISLAASPSELAEM